MVPGRKQNAFTLIELLLTISIIVILMVMTFGGIRIVRENARSAASLSNLRQIGVAMNLYAAENDNYFPPAWDGSKTYANHLEPYLEADLKQSKNIFVSPNAKVPIVAGHFGITYSAHGLLCDDTTDGDDRPKRGAIKYPSQLILAADGAQNPENNGQAYAHFWNPWELYLRGSEMDRTQAIPSSSDEDTAACAGWMRYRNNGAVNAVMVDGHVETIKKGKVVYGNVLID